LTGAPARGLLIYAFPKMVRSPRSLRPGVKEALRWQHSFRSFFFSTLLLLYSLFFAWKSPLMKHADSLPPKPGDGWEGQVCRVLVSGGAACFSGYFPQAIPRARSGGGAYNLSVLTYCPVLHPSSEAISAPPDFFLIPQF